MKCYIATFYQYENYGTRLQNYAMCRALQKIGISPVTIMLRNKKENGIRHIKDICAALPLLCDRQRIWLNDKKKRSAFCSFNEKLFFQAMNYKTLQKLDFSDAVTIAGSDQIWSPMHLTGRKQETELYFLRFAPKEKRYTYAPSFGVETIPEKMETMYRRYISDIEYLSVRELTGKNIIKKLTDRDAPVLPDPVFLLSGEEWKKKAGESDQKIPQGNYIITYFLSRHSETVHRKIEEFAEKRNAEMVNIAGKYFEKGDMVPSPDEFVGLIDGAQALFTDSFHGSAFAIIMKTPFLVFQRQDVNQFSRLEMLLQTYKLTSAFVDHEEREDYDKLLDGMTMDIEEIVEGEREKALVYLKQIFGKNSE